MYKKIGSFLILIIVLIGNIVGISAAGTHNVKDNLNYLTQGQVNELQNMIDSIKSTYSLDTVIVITNDTNGKSSMDYADDYYENNGYGEGSDKSGLLMLINMQKREVWISTTGKAISIFTDSRISAMVGNVKGQLSGGNYYSACNIFLGDVLINSKSGVPEEDYSGDGSSASQGSPYTSYSKEPQKSKTYFEKAVMLSKSFPVYIIALVLSVVATLIISLSNKGKVTINNLTYEEGGSFQLSGAVDDYIRESTTRTKIERNTDNNDSGSSTHTDSSGTTHGGGGGSF